MWNSVWMVLRDAIFLGKTVFPVRQKGVAPLLLPACVLQLSLKPCSIISTFCFEGNCDSSSSLLDVCCSSQTVLFASQMWAARPHLSSIFEKLLHRKTFSCLRLIACSLHEKAFLLVSCFMWNTAWITLRDTTQIRFGKAGAHPQLALRIAIAHETLFHHFSLSFLKAIAILPVLS